ncbi:MAG: hypothetical protein A2017_08215 [Lentisphaerae bacterium GWF2_44_16]|nr:MAG: hypothetical protein A2017_08215 [Lentisphaerae bacterium GWF2_44_16]
MKKYIETADKILEDIIKNKKVGDKLDASEALCKKYAVSEITVKKAMQLLAERKIVLRKPKAGTVVIDNQEAKSFNIMSSKKVIRILTIRDWNFSNAIKGICHKYSKYNEDVSFDIDDELPSFDTSKIYEKADTDIFLVNTWLMREIVTGERVKNFLPFDEIPGLWYEASDSFEEVTKWCTADSKLMCMPISFTTVLTCINRDKKNALPVSRFENMKLDEFKDILIKSKGADGDIYPFYVNTTMNRWPLTMKSLGGELFSKDGKKCLLDSNECVKAINFMLDLMYNSKCCPPVTFSEEMSRGMRDIFKCGKFTYAWNSGAAMNGNYDFNIAFAPLPYEKRRASHLLIEGLMVNRATDKLDTIRDFLNFIQLYENRKFISDNSDGISCNRAMAGIYTEEMNKKYEGFNHFIKSLEYAEPLVRVPENSLIKKISEKLYPVWLGVESAKAACRSISAEINEDLKMRKKGNSIDEK